jgi:hypothetical protein
MEVVFMRHVLFALAAFWLATPVAISQPVTDPLLEHFSGTWVLRGTLAGKQTTHDITSQWILGHQYLQIHERSRETDSKGQPQYEALVLVGWEAASSQYQCLWLDSTGGGGLAGHAVALGKRDGQSIPFVFKEPDGTVSFVNTFSYESATNSWTWELDNVKKGTRVPFGRVRLTQR